MNLWKSIKEYFEPGPIVALYDTYTQEKLRVFDPVGEVTGDHVIFGWGDEPIAFRLIPNYEPLNHTLETYGLTERIKDFLSEVAESPLVWISNKGQSKLVRIDKMTIQIQPKQCLLYFHDCTIGRYGVIRGDKTK